jgi:hypothetical protein
MKRITKWLLCGAVVSVCVSITSVTLQFAEIRRDVKRAQERGEVLLFCGHPWLSAVEHGVLTFAGWYFIALAAVLCARRNRDTDYGHRAA